MWGHVNAKFITPHIYSQNMILCIPTEPSLGIDQQAHKNTDSHIISEACVYVTTTAHHPEHNPLNLTFGPALPNVPFLKYILPHPDLIQTLTGPSCPQA